MALWRSPRNGLQPNVNSGLGETTDRPVPVQDETFTQSYIGGVRRLAGRTGGDHVKTNAGKIEIGPPQSWAIPNPGFCHRLRREGAVSLEAPSRKCGEERPRSGPVSPPCEGPMRPFCPRLIVGGDWSGDELTS